MNCRDVVLLLLQYRAASIVEKSGHTPLTLLYKVMYKMQLGSMAEALESMGAVFDISNLDTNEEIRVNKQKELI